jgi:hypothetical protein
MSKIDHNNISIISPEILFLINLEELNLGHNIIFENNPINIIPQELLPIINTEMLF